MTKNTRILIAAHKPYKFPSDDGYFPIHVGKDLVSEELGLQGDNYGNHISNLNRSFCELTGIYWLWQNAEYEYAGLTHYRRYFKPTQPSYNVVMGKHVARSEDLLSILKQYDVIVPRKRCYYIDTVQSHYAAAHYFSDLLELECVLNEKYPEYLPAFRSVLNSRSLYLYNMFVMHRINFDKYCDFVFDILFELEKRIPYKGYGVYQKRVFGFLSERLFNVWIIHNASQLKVKELDVVNIEGERVLNKFFGLLIRKFLGYKKV